MNIFNWHLSMETTDDPSANTDNHGSLMPIPFKPRALGDLAAWEIKELILRLEAEQRRREQARWEEAERVRRQNPPDPASIYVLTAEDFVFTNLDPLVNTNSICMTSGIVVMLLGTILHSLECRVTTFVQVFFFIEAINIADLISPDDDIKLLVLCFSTLELQLQAFCILLYLQPFQ